MAIWDILTTRRRSDHQPRALECTDNGDLYIHGPGAGGGMPVTVTAYTTPTHTVVNVTTNTSEVLAANANRLYALLVNDSDTVIYIMLGAAAVASQGIRLNAAGGSYEMGLGNLYTGAINGIHAGAGNKVLLILEGT